MLSFLLPLLVAVAPATSPEISSANLKKTPAFQDWRGGRFLLDERWVELPEAGLRVGYFVVPSPRTRESSDNPPFHDAFFVVDSRTGQPVAPALVRTSLPLNGCPTMGKVARLIPEPESETSAAVRFGNDAQRCLVRFRRTKEAWVVSLFPDEARSPVETFPEAAVALEKVLGPRDGGARNLSWSYLPNSRWLLAASEGECALWVIDSLTLKLNTTASEAMTREICECLKETVSFGDLYGQLPQTVYSMSWTGGGTALPTCDCTFAQTGEASVTCKEYMGREYSLPEFEEMAEDGRLTKKMEDANRMELEDSRRTHQGLLAANEEALSQWKTGHQKEALAAWTTLYRTWLESGRLVIEGTLDAITVEDTSLRKQMNQQLNATIDLRAEILNNLGFALWSQKEWSQAEAVLDECLALLTETGRERNVLHLNRGDLFRDMGKGPEAIKAYRSFLQRKGTAAQRKHAERELRKLEPGSK
ncbi:tetratricopeptide repeat protein [Myxococcus llanfairpwllgwyngyllgogerychwyrndrobwllllantysiliogogogochensis]|uniref:Tetratricopeptide repeat protein n=2 Tax=Myxococcus llanfairpwllgwyngyllgogerychwyrndrobwllllantysiliogogogochensis TaxID=2590453 RepID=A0A540X4S6_9BACT|nr:tetratricopeptide repeat protein [Myxococcus llanfairpwllgwyngyllgogerychwyrndrobwllllantysiliogogogochensis]